MKIANLLHDLYLQVQLADSDRDVRVALGDLNGDLRQGRVRVVGEPGHRGEHPCPVRKNPLQKTGKSRGNGRASACYS